MKQLLQDYRVKQVPLEPGLVLPEETPLQDVVKAMQTQKTGCVVLTHGGAVTGIFTEWDVLYRVVGESVDWQKPVKEFATPNPETVTQDEMLKKALYLMRKKDFRHIPVFADDGKLLGVMSIIKVIKLLAEHFPQEIMNLPPKIHSHHKAPEGG